ncbi:MAG: alpha/beta hydrolase, partial [Eubacterium sp.]|nr:alpha/beta hydrolase [Eubacterium sp.]
DTAVLLLKLRGGYNLRDAAPIDVVGKSTTPTLFIHGDQDAMISVDMAYRLYDEASCDKELLIVKGAGHAQCKDKDPAQFVDTVFLFLRNYIR